MRKIIWVIFIIITFSNSNFSNAQYFSGGISGGVYKPLGIGIINPGVNLNLIIHSVRKPKNGFGMDYNYYGNGKYEYMEKPRPVFYNTPEIMIKANATVRFQTFEFYVFKYLKGNVDEKFNIYLKFNFGYVAGFYTIHYEPYDTYQYDFADIESEAETESGHRGSGDGFVGLTLGFEKGVNNLRLFFEFAYNRAVLTPVFGLYNEVSYQPFGNFNILKLNIGFRKRLFFKVNLDQL